MEYTPLTLAQRILEHPEKQKTVEIAVQITNIVYRIRANVSLIPSVDPENLLFHSTTIRELRPLIKSFREEATKLLSEQMPESDDTLYKSVIAPVVLSEIDKAV
jgi:hypothetical protein